MTVVPDADELIIEAYSFMRYGYLEGEVESVSPDAVVDDTRGLVFPARIRITGSTLRSLGKVGTPQTDRKYPDTDYNSLLTPGLSAAVEIKTGKRSVLSFLLSPVARSLSEAGRER